MTAQPIKLVITTPAFFANVKKLRVEECPVANRTYFLDAKNRIVAVGAPVEARP